MGICQQCIHYRRLKPASQLLSLAMGTTDAAISNALTKIQEDEIQQKGHEAQFRAKKENANDEIWGFRPVMSGFCGLQEDKLYDEIQEGKQLIEEGEFTSHLRELEGEGNLIAEVKNFGGRCTDFETRQLVKRSCSTCAHRIASQGEAKDQEVEKAYGSMAVGSISVGLSTSTPDNLLNKHREGVASHKANELSGVYAAKGTIMTKPQYLDYCGKFSADEEYVVCLLQNPHHTCWAWEPAGGQPVVAAAPPDILSRRSSPGDAAGGQPVVAAAPPARARLFTMATPGVAGRIFQINKSPVTIGRDPSNDIVISDPSVSRQHAQLQWTGGSGWSIKKLAANNFVTINQVNIQQATIKDHDTIGLGRNTSFLFLIDTAEQKSSPPLSVDSPHVAQPQIKRAEEVLVNGPSPLTKVMVDQAGEYFEWALDVKLTEVARTLLQEMLIDDWTRKDTADIQEAQTYIATLNEVKKANQATRDYWREVNQPNLVKGLQASPQKLAKYLLQLYEAANTPLAPGNPPLTRETANASLELLGFMIAVVRGMEPVPLSKEVKDAWIQQLIAIYENVPSDVQNWMGSTALTWPQVQAAWPEAPEADRARLKQQWTQQLGPLLESWQPAVTPKKSEIASSIDDMLAAQRKEEEEMLAIDPQLARQKKLQNQAINASFFSNMMQMQHQTNMAINNNIKF